MTRINHRKPKSRKKFTLHDVLLSYQPISTADLAHLGWIGCANWLVAQKDIVENENFCSFWLSTTIFDIIEAKLERTHFSFI